MKVEIFNEPWHWHIKIGRFYLGFWWENGSGWEIWKAHSKYMDFSGIAFGIGELRWYTK